jgi:hypothetical protein
MLDREKILKLMMLTTSDNDHEALSALRKANAIIKKAKQTWQDVVYKAPAVPVQAQKTEADLRSDRLMKALYDIPGVNVDIELDGDTGNTNFRITRGPITVHYCPQTEITLVNGKRRKWSLDTLIMNLKAVQND